MLSRSTEQANRFMLTSSAPRRWMFFSAARSPSHHLLEDTLQVHFIDTRQTQLHQMNHLRHRTCAEQRSYPMPGAVSSDAEKGVTAFVRKAETDGPRQTLFSLERGPQHRKVYRRENQQFEMYCIWCSNNPTWGGIVSDEKVYGHSRTRSGGRATKKVSNESSY